MDLSIDSRSLVWWRTPAALTWLWIRTLLFSFTRFGWSLAAPLRSQTCFGTADFFFFIILQQFLALLHVWMNRVQLHIIQSGSMLPLLAPPCYWWKITYRGILSNRESEPSKPRHTHTHTPIDAKWCGGRRKRRCSGGVWWRYEHGYDRCVDQNNQATYSTVVLVFMTNCWSAVISHVRTFMDTGESVTVSPVTLVKLSNLRSRIRQHSFFFLHFNLLF